MHEEIVHILWSWGLVLLSRKSGHSFLVNVNMQGVDAVHEHVDSKVKFKTINQERLRQISLSDNLSILVNIIGLLGKVDALPFTANIWFDNEKWLLLLVLQLLVGFFQKLPKFSHLTG